MKQIVRLGKKSDNSSVSFPSISGTAAPPSQSPLFNINDNFNNNFNIDNNFNDNFNDESLHDGSIAMNSVVDGPVEGVYDGMGGGGMFVSSPSQSTVTMNVTGGATWDSAM